MAEKLLEIENLSVEYNTEIATVYAVNGLSLSLNYGSSRRRLSPPTSHTTGHAVPHPAVQLT